MRHRFSVFSLLSLLVLFKPSVSVGEPIVIYDNGQSIPLRNQPKTRHYQYPVSANFNIKLEPLPVKTPAMTPGKVQTRTIDRPTLNRPVFIVGADPMSLQWLRLHQRQLKKINATGIAVNVESKQQLDILRKAGGGLDINPLSGETIARQLALFHYPVLMTSTRIEQ